MSSARKCDGCHELVELNRCMTCSKCKAYYDLLCANITQERFDSMRTEEKQSWICQYCRSKVPKADNTNTPIRSNQKPVKSIGNQRSSGISAPQESCNQDDGVNVTIRRKDAKSHDISYEADNLYPEAEQRLRTIIRSEFQETLQAMMEKLITKELQPINQILKEFRESVDFFNGKYEELKSAVEERNASIHKLEVNNIELQSTITDLTLRLNLAEQHLRENNVEINGVTEHGSENLVSTIMQLSSTVKAQLKDDDVLHVTRVAKLDRNSNRPRSIIAKFRSTRQRDSFLAAVANYNRNNKEEKLNTRHLGIAGQRSPVYVSEHLIPSTKALHAAARLKAREMNYKFVWVRNGRVYVRRNEVSGKAIFIRNKECLKFIV